MIFKISEHVLKNAAEICNSLKDIESIIADSKLSLDSKDSNVSHLSAISDLIQSHGVGEFLGSNVLHKHFTTQEGQMVVWQ